MTTDEIEFSSGGETAIVAARFGMNPNACCRSASDRFAPSGAVSIA